MTVGYIKKYEQWMFIVFLIMTIAAFFVTMAMWSLIVILVGSIMGIIMHSNKKEAELKPETSDEEK